MNLFVPQKYIVSDGIKEFFINNNLLPAMASVSIGLVSSDFVKSLVGDIIFPLIVLILRSTKIKALQIPLTNNTKFDFLKFFRSLVSLIVIVYTTYLFITYLSKLVGKDEKKIESDNTKK
jgi:large-conductance mechanosensitive channel